MIGAIIIWSGLVSTIPAGWQLCDGSNGTPDLRFRFVFGAFNDLSVGLMGGNAVHTHNFTGDGHNHDIHDVGPANIQIGAPFHRTTNTKPAVGTTDLSSNLPPYYTLAYIQRMS